MNDAIVNLIIKEEGWSAETNQSTWSMQLVVGGVSWQVGPQVRGRDIQDAAQNFARMLSAAMRDAK